jgi:Mg-chelatase subunit ChlD
MAFSVEATSEIIELSGKLGLTELGQGLMHSVLEHSGGGTDGKLISEAISEGFGGFVPDTIYEQLVSNYKYAEQLYGKTFVNLISGYDADYVGKNIALPEFQRDLKKRILEKVESLHDEGLIDDEYRITEKGVQLSALVLYVEELELLAATPRLGERVTRKRAFYGSKGATHVFHKGDRYRDIALKSSVKRAIRRGHSRLIPGDLEAYERQKHGAVTIIYGIDASGSMKGRKIDLAKRAGVALAFAASSARDTVGLVVFSHRVKETVAPTTDFGLLLRTIAAVRAAHETDITALIQKAIELFPKDETTKHLIVLSDALPTVGKQPEKETLDAVAQAQNIGITVSLVGVNLDAKGEKFAQHIADVGRGRFYLVKNVEELDAIVLEDYWGVG